uniref:Uncharacterized protein n=1 Tax=Chromera velia CCMP2878 TaxID=1169474 RepID=A0A0G4H8Q0_9ALVE|eukprot:Cvel_25239.t1-p1 / transcript=Cvel_25239.t1 / gene=Cvel_25239 / organism=Chromera_velia_CCMP2878 / gene_product=hypothetical protein / transcript_product=hypothetical protein / location=Cvel_scaffold2831:11591-12040(-) / protein_length=150 / sequence_SO=supercontig / SO=protein_coding / is_pseudo=false
MFEQFYLQGLVEAQGGVFRDESEVGGSGGPQGETLEDFFGDEMHSPAELGLTDTQSADIQAGMVQGAELTNSGCLAAQKQDGSNTNSNSKRVRGSPSHPVIISPQPNRSPRAPTPGKPKSQRKSSQQLPPPIDSIHIEESDHEEEKKEVP